MFGKLMSVSDSLMWRYYELLSLQPMSAITQLKTETEAGRNPRDAKVALAQEIITRYHSQADAEAALLDFEARFRQGAIPDDILAFTLQTAGAGISVLAAAKQANLTESNAEAARLVAAGGLRINGEKVADRNLHLAVGETVVLQAGKRKFARITIA
jgi:tyrosyl-tRNA synthetase